MFEGGGANTGVGLGVLLHLQPQRFFYLQLASLNPFNCRWMMCLPSYDWFGMHVILWCTHIMSMHPYEWNRYSWEELHVMGSSDHIVKLELLSAPLVPSWFVDGEYGGQFILFQVREYFICLSHLPFRFSSWNSFRSYSFLGIPINFIHILPSIPFCIARTSSSVLWKRTELFRNLLIDFSFHLIQNTLQRYWHLFCGDLQRLASIPKGW